MKLVENYSFNCDLSVCLNNISRSSDNISKNNIKTIEDKQRTIAINNQANHRLFPFNDFHGYLNC